MPCTACPSGVERLSHEVFSGDAGAWDDLLSRSHDNRIFYTSTWLRLWWKHFGAGSPHIFALCEEGTLRAALSLQLQDRENEKVVSLLGDHNVSDYMDGLADKPDALELMTSLWAHALKTLTWDSLDLRHVPSSSVLISALERAADEANVTVDVVTDSVCPVALLCSSWDGYLQMLTKKQRHEIRRKLRRAQEEVPWQWRTASSDEDVDRDLPVFFRLHEAVSDEKAGFMSSDMRAFFRDLAHEMLRLGRLRLSIFQRDGIDIAASMGFVYRDRYLLYNSGYDPAYAVHSPGIAAVAHAMQDAIEEKAVAFDFLSGEEPYKYQFGASNTTTSRVRARRVTG